MKRSMRKTVLVKEAEYWAKIRKAAKKGGARTCHK